MRSNKVFSLYCALIISACFLGLFGRNCLPAESYLVGGSEPLSAELQAKLDRHHDLIRLGINTDWLKSSKVDQVKFIEAITKTAEAVSTGVMPGAVIYVDRLDRSMMPIAVGHLMTDPELRKNSYDTLYHIGDLTGPLVTVPLTYMALVEQKISLEDTLDKILPEYACPEKGEISVEMLLRHSSGLPSVCVYPDEVRCPKDLKKFLQMQPPAVMPCQRVQPSVLNMALLGKILEKVYDKPLSELATEKLHRPIGMVQSTMTLPVTWRAHTAPGAYSNFLGRLAWGEPDDQLGALLTPNAGHTGLITTADDLATMARVLLFLKSQSGNAESEVSQVSEKSLLGDDSPTGQIMSLTSVLNQMLTPDNSTKGGDTMGLGFKLGKFGEGSFGWDSQTGSSFWILPEENAFIIFLSNMDHPDGKPNRGVTSRQEILNLLAEALKNGRNGQEFITAGESP